MNLNAKLTQVIFILVLQLNPQTNLKFIILVNLLKINFRWQKSSTWRCERYKDGCKGEEKIEGDVITVTENYDYHLQCPLNSQKFKVISEIKSKAKRGQEPPRR